MAKRYPPVILATCVVPWKSDWTLDDALFRQEIRLLRDNLTRHLYVFGTAGEGYAVSDRQFDAIVDLFRQEMPGPENHPMVGVISLSLSTMIERIERCRDSGITRFQVSLPSWGRLTDREVAVFFHEVCDRFPSCRFMHYNLPRSGRVLTGDDYARLSADHPNLVAVKYGGGPDRAGRMDMLQKAPALQFFFTEQGYAECRDEAECGLLISLALCHFAMARRFLNARGSELRLLSEELAFLGKALEQAVGEEGHIDGAFDKVLIRLHLPQFSLRLLPPYAFAGDTCMETFRSRIPANWRTSTDEGS
ncbi:MAG TPA: dihydrodipicolinate synthase family protein [Phycisphaerae bacterium]|nr:dihydrodipicolinate synthase family protein [Phycisphaerae bacterium]HRY70460.1 dihydrodipicolinate synthase family protein [Phycisphaerae bacterium]HSA27694.1 dihydrodipicolinate synthase family protein [Phycisphaerae bacterium]